MKSILGKQALVTGAASGIGKAIATKLAIEGAELYLVDIDQPGLELFADELRRMGTQVTTRRCDLSDPQALDACLSELLAEWKGVDIVVNNAGLGYYGPTDEMTDDQWNALMGVNLLAPAQIIRRLLPALRERGETRIVNIASMVGLVALKRAAAYSLTKFGIVGFGEALRSELSPFGIGVITICPGFVSTNIFRSTMRSPTAKSLKQPPRLLCVSPDYIATRVMKAIHKNQSLVVITWYARLLWRINRLFPTLLNGASITMRGWRTRVRAMMGYRPLQQLHPKPRIQLLTNARA